MRAQDVGQRPPQANASDVAVPQRGSCGEFAFQFVHLSDIVNEGRTQAVFHASRGPGPTCALQEHRSRGCRAPRSPFWLWQWSLLRLVAPRKATRLFTSINRPLPSSQATRANTSDLIGRVASDAATPPDRPLQQAKAAHSLYHPFAPVAAPLYDRVVASDAIWRLSCVPLLSSLLFSSLSPGPAPANPHRWSKSFRSASSRPIPANTSNAGCRARSLAPGPRRPRVCALGWTTC